MLIVQCIFIFQKDIPVWSMRINILSLIVKMSRIETIVLKFNWNSMVPRSNVIPLLVVERSRNTFRE